MTRKLALSDAEIAAEYQSGRTLQQIAVRHGIGVSTVAARLRSMGVERRAAKAARKHGTRKSYARGCRCGPCSVAERVARARKWDRARERLRAGEIEHGSVMAYSAAQCRCQVCTSGHATRARVRRAERSPLFPQPKVRTGTADSIVVAQRQRREIAALLPSLDDELRCLVADQLRDAQRRQWQDTHTVSLDAHASGERVSRALLSMIDAGRE